ncbi:MAG: aminopeptidase [Oscillospiraceae bacterium]|nr:aminopeptidase [Oscillospiraceae bacterium]
MTHTELLKKYAEFAVEIGVNPQKNQTLIINCDVMNADFARACAEVAYAKGAREVVVHYGDENLSRIKMDRTALDVLTDVKPYIERSYLDYAESEGGACVLHIISPNPEIYKGLDGTKVDKAGIARRSALKNWRSYTMNDRVQWCIVAVPSAPWASKIFPGFTEQEAVEKLWKTIFDVCRVTNGDPVGEWKEHIAKMCKWRDHLNSLHLDRIHMQSGNGTDLVIGLADDHVWEGAQSHTPEGYRFIANIPTEEVFTAPHKDRVNGVVKGTKPYVYNGSLIENFSVTFKDGKVTEYSATSGQELLGMLLDTDEGARHIGEIALVPVSSPINKANVLFYNTLFDENAACHIAFGAGYPGTVKGGTSMSKEQLLEKGVNDSVVHEDVMVGAADTQITGYTKDGQAVEIFKNGQWAF